MCTPPHELFWRTPVKVNQRKKIAVWNIGVMGSIAWITFVSSSKKTQKFFLPLILSGRVGAEKFDFLWLKTHHYCIYLRFAIQNDFFTILYIWHRLCVHTWRHSIHIKWHETTPFSRKWTIFHEAYRHLRKYADNIFKRSNTIGNIWWREF